MEVISTGSTISLLLVLYNLMYKLNIDYELKLYVIFFFLQVIGDITMLLKGEIALAKIDGVPGITTQENCAKKNYSKEDRN